MNCPETLEDCQQLCSKLLVIFQPKMLFLLHPFKNNPKKTILTAEWLKKFLRERLRENYKINPEAPSSPSTPVFLCLPD